MELDILLFWAFVSIGLQWLKRNPESVFGRTAFTWIGPLPVLGETRSQFQLRWALYSFDWLCRFALAFSAIYFFGTKRPGIYEQTWFKVALFATPIGLGIATLATIGFFLKAAMIRLVGPNPAYLPMDKHEANPDEVCEKL